MDELPSIDQWLVTPENPPRSVVGLDHERCAALHNYLIQYAWASSNRDLGSLETQSWFEKYGEEANNIREHLNPTLINFLEAAYDCGGGVVSLFYWVSGFNPPDWLWKNWEGVAEDGEEHRRLTLYNTHTGLLGGHVDGLCYDQKTSKAIMFISTDDHDFASGEDGAHLWQPLETVLSKWIMTLRKGKITAGPDGISLNNEKFGPWLYHSYSAQQVEDTVAAFNRLVIAIESRIPAARRRWPTTIPILSDRILDSASISNPSFARSFLRSIRLPSFKFIAPGLMVPTPETFVASQLFTPIRDEDDLLTIPPVLLFRANETFKFDHDDKCGQRNPYSFIYTTALQHTPIPAGVYTDAISRRSEDTAEEGFRFILPYTIGENEFARKSTGQLIDEGNFKDLYQHGFKPFGGDWSRAQRLVKLLDNWTSMVERGLWAVGEDGVMGGIEKFKEADTKTHWKDYWIEPDW
ncbi:hypothetical protein B7494_g3051 [Chlorociboria aeruginascens]|nr:hypothetical protein B7494_g3051 [Chlorociboria aeruginascens]